MSSRPSIAEWPRLRRHTGWRDKVSMPRTRRSQACWLASDGRMGPGRTRKNRASDKGRARSALRSERKPSIIFLRRQAVHRWGLPTGSISNFVGFPARIRVLGRLYRAPETLRGGSITLMDGRGRHRGGRVLCAGGSRHGPGPRSEAAAVGKLARNPRRVCIAVRRSQRTLADLIAGRIRQPGPAQWLRGAPFFL